MAIAFFDLDRTLLAVNAGHLWVRRELRLGFITRWQATKAAVWIAGYHLGYGRIEHVLEDAIATLEGGREEDIEARTQAFYREDVAATYRAGARAVVDRHRAEGHVLALLTSSTNYLAKPVQLELGIPHALCTRFEVVDGRFTGRPVRPLCFGRGKLEHARALAGDLGEALEDAWFYTDSASDVAVLEAVGHPVVVHPDPTLARIARRRAWPIEDWSQIGYRSAVNG